MACIGCPKAGGFRIVVVVVWDGKGRATRCGSRGAARGSAVTKGEAMIRGGIGGGLRARNREDSNRLRVLPGKGPLVAPSFHNSIWRSRSRGAADGVRGLAGSMRWLLRQNESGSNIGPPPIHQQAHCLEWGGVGGVHKRGRQQTWVEVDARGRPQRQWFKKHLQGGRRGISCKGLFKG